MKRFHKQVLKPFLDDKHLKRPNVEDGLVESLLDEHVYRLMKDIVSFMKCSYSKIDALSGSSIPLVYRLDILFLTPRTTILFPMTRINLFLCFQFPLCKCSMYICSATVHWLSMGFVLHYLVPCTSKNFTCIAITPTKENLSFST